MNVFKVYWMSPQNLACSQDFESMTDALNHTQHLREIGRTFVTLVSEMSDNVTKLGVAEVGPDYDWKKRRL